MAAQRTAPGSEPFGRRAPLGYNHGSMNATPFFRRPIVRMVLGLILWLALYVFVLTRLETPATPLAILGDIALGLGSLFLTLTLTAQFVLPVRTWADRLSVVRRLFNHMIGLRAPVIFIQNGRAIASRGERQRRGKGVLLIDYASGAVLRTKTQFTRAVGPGVIFTDSDEGLAEALDLQRQIRSVEGAPPPSGEETEAEGITAQGLTQEGIPISADLSVTFILDPGHPGAPREGRHAHLPPYEFNAGAAERAVYGHAYQDDEDIPWTELPLHLVTDLWRERVKNWRLEALLDASKDRPTPQQQIQAEILTQLTAPEPKGKKRKASKNVLSREAEILQSRGIRVLDVNFANLYVPADVHETHMRRWREAWAGAMQTGLREARQEAEEAHALGTREAQETLARKMTTSLRAKLANGEKPNLRDTLALLLRDAERLCYEGDPITDASTLATHLRDIQEHLEGLEGDCARPEKDVTT
jgi:hypothetical protein